MADFGGMELRALVDLGGYEAAKIAYDNLDSWSADVRVPHKEWIGKSVYRPSPKGVVLIVGPCNYPFFCTMIPLASAIAAGNCVVIKPSEVSTNSGKLLEALVNKYLDTSAIKVVQGGVPETTELLKQKFDHIFYTGSSTVGRIVLKAAALHLTPVTLELGGKAPVIIDSSANMDVVIPRVVLGKILNSGQTCVAPDYILVHESRKDELIDKLVSALKKCFGGNARTSSEFGKIISAHHVKRLAKFFATKHGKVISPCLGDKEPPFDEDALYVTPSLVIDPHEDDLILKEEVFGPLISVKSFTTIENAIETVGRICKEPLAIYVFSENKTNVERIINETESGGVCVNSVFEQCTNRELPFGGKGESGSGMYFGKFGFDTFSHQRAIFYKDSTVFKDSLFPLPPHPSWLYDLAAKAVIFGFIPRRFQAYKAHMFSLFLVAVYLMKS
eukprot:CAMPEP_0203747106 /NCGR_PEP_ID=MMETSP0098-20131031/2351_1 /ASSEMBLY_ACC=CAM_ASM_000208 /TAXON_ID=96639 /ORGANISM=" , Strain NY0313808BC1" /LENGTH=444 /DNA_ID=CAMNT_0050635429 /DNA_START=2981 /DNA_END=4315 /DNA_ORIENTATION=-